VCANEKNKKREARQQKQQRRKTRATKTKNKNQIIKELTGQDDGVLAEQGDAASIGGPDGVFRA
jgi:hypothetical protein